MVTEGELNREIASGEDPEQPIRRMLRSAHAWIHDRPRLRHMYRVTVGILGAGIAAFGLLLVPLPGPGWLVVFIGLAILGTEFAWARHLAGAIKRLLSRFRAWWRERKQSAAQ